MIKKTKALVAAGAGAAVLLASGATFALWQDSDAIAGAEINTGTLSISASQFVWTYGVDDGFTDSGAVIDPLEFALVPGDVIVGDVELFETVFEGDNIAVALDVTIGEVSETFWAHPQYDFDVAEAASLVFADLGTLGFEDLGLSVSPSLTDGVLSLTIDWTNAPDPLETEGGTAGGAQADFVAFSIDDIELTLRQVRPGYPAAPWNN